MTSPILMMTHRRRYWTSRGDGAEPGRHLIIIYLVGDLNLALQQSIDGLAIGEGPSWTQHNGKETWLAWKGEGTDKGIYVASTPSLTPDERTGKYAFTSQQQVLAITTLSAPAITSLDGTLYLFWRGVADNDIYWATSSDGEAWTDNGKVGIGDSLIPADNNQHAQTKYAPTVVSAGNALYLFWTGASDGAINWTVFDGRWWMPHAKVTTSSGMPKTDASPAAAVNGANIYLVWKGDGDATIWKATNSMALANTGGPWSDQVHIFDGAGSAPVLTCDSEGAIWLAWTDSTAAVFYTSLNSGNRQVRHGIASSGRPALILTGPRAEGIMMAWKGENDSKVYYGLLVNPLTAYSGAHPLLIIAPAAFMDQIQPLITHKNTTGIQTIAASVESITTFFPGADEAEQVKRAIAFAHETLSTDYIFLVGDAAHVPVRFWFDHLGPSPTYADGSVIPCEPAGVFVQSDLYYSSLYHHTGTYPQMVSGAFDTWDANDNGLFNEAWAGNVPVDPANTGGGLNTALNPDGVDGYPDVVVGRIPARNTADVASYVAKVIAYETRASPSALTFTFVADQAYGDFDASTGFGAIVNDGSVKINYLMIENTGASISPFANATPQQVAQKAGDSTWMSYLGHGGPTAWGYNSVFTADDVALTKKTSGLPVVFASGCGTALFMPNTPWNGYSGNVVSIDVNGVTRGPFVVNPDASPSTPGVVITDTATGRAWGTPTGPHMSPLPVATPRPGVFNIPIDCCAHFWLFDAAPGGAIVYIGDHCVSNDDYPAEIQTNLLKAYRESVNAPLGALYLLATREYWAGPHAQDATTPGLGDYHGIPRLYLGWMVYFGDPSLRIPAFQVQH